MNPIALIGYPILQWKLRHLRRFRRSLRDVAKNQSAILREKLQMVAGSSFARDFGINPNMTVEQFRSEVPIFGYDRISPYIERVMSGEHSALFKHNIQIIMYAVSSGTTGPSKYIPITREQVNEYERTWTIWAGAVAENRPEIAFNKVVNLASGWRAGKAQDGVPLGSISGKLATVMHSTLRLTNVLPPHLAEYENTKERYYLYLRLALSYPNVRMLTTANPSTLIQFAQWADLWKEDLIKDIADGSLSRCRDMPIELRALVSGTLRRERRGRALEISKAVDKRGSLLPKDVWPSLSLLGVWTGGTTSPYLNRLPYFYGDLPLRDHGLSASEGRITIPLTDNSAAGVLDVTTNFYEFIPVAARSSPESSNNRLETLLAHELAEGQDYFVLLTTSGGLLRYDLHDVVRCEGFLGEAPLLRFLNKGSQYTSITGEKLSAFQVAEAFRRAVFKFGVDLVDFTLQPTWGDPPYYRLIFEADAPEKLGDANQFVREFDRCLCQANYEYNEKRRSERLGLPQLVVVASGSFRKLRDDRMQKFGVSLEQYKHPLLLTDMDYKFTA